MSAYKRYGVNNEIQGRSRVIALGFSRSGLGGNGGEFVNGNRVDLFASGNPCAPGADVFCEDDYIFWNETENKLQIGPCGAGKRYTVFAEFYVQAKNSPSASRVRCRWNPEFSSGYVVDPIYSGMPLAVNDRTTSFVTKSWIASRNETIEVSADGDVTDSHQVGCQFTIWIQEQ